MITTDNEDFAKKMRLFRNHSIGTDQREEQRSWFYEMFDLGYNFRLTNIQSAAGISQLKKIPIFLNAEEKLPNIRIMPVG
jgi:perosamine synthetase